MGGGETGIDAALIRTTAREFASHRPATLVHPGRRVNWYGDDTQRSRAIALLSALLGNWGRRGGLSGRRNEVRAVSAAGVPEGGQAQGGRPGGAQFPFADEGITTSIRDATLTGKPYPIKGWFVYSTNILYALPNEAETREAIEKLDLLVVSTRFRARSPVTPTWCCPRPRFSSAMTNSWSVWPHRLDVAAPACRRGAERSEARLVDREAAREEARHRRLHAVQGHGGIPALPHREVRLQWADLKRDGVIMGKTAPITVEEGLELAFDTPSKKVEFWSDQLAGEGFDPVPKYKPPAEAPTGYFRLITGRAPVHTFSRTQTNPYLQDLMRENEVWVNAATAARGSQQRPVCAAQEPGRRGQQPHPRQGDAAHPARLRLHGLRLRPHQQDAEERVPEGGAQRVPQLDHAS